MSAALRLGHQLLDAKFFQFLGELAFAAPHDILLGVIDEDLGRHAIGGDRRPHHLNHQRRRLAAKQAIARDKAAMIIQEGQEVDAPVLPLEHERKQIGLPQLVGLGALEATDMIGLRLDGLLNRFIAGFFQHPRHGVGTGRQQHVAD